MCSYLENAYVQYHYGFVIYSEFLCLGNILLMVVSSCAEINKELLQKVI